MRGYGARELNESIIYPESQAINKDRLPHIWEFPGNTYSRWIVMQPPLNSTNQPEMLMQPEFQRRRFF